MWDLTNARPDSRVRILAIDPGSSTLGFTMLLVDPIDGTITVDDCFTVTATKHIAKDSIWFQMYGAKAARLAAIKKITKGILNNLRPDILIAESPFVGRFAAAFEALVEVRDAIKEAVYDYDPTLEYQSIDPMTAKKAVGAVMPKGRKSDKKTPVRDAVLAIQDLEWSDHVDKEALDEHSIDSVAVGYWRAKVFLFEGK